MPIYAEVAGEGPDLVLVHEGICDSRMWDEQWEPYARAVPRPALRPARLRPLAARAGHLLERAATCSTCSSSTASSARRSLGVSLGGRVVLEVAIARPDLVSALVLVAPGLPGHDWSQEMQARLGRGGGRTRGGRPGRGGRGEPAHLGRRARGGSPRTSTRPCARASARCSDAPSSSRSPSARPPRRSRSCPTLPARLGEVTAPTLILVGDEDVAGHAGDRRAARARDSRCAARRRSRTRPTCRAWSGPASSTSSCSPFLREAGVSTVAPAELVERIWERDPTLWTGKDEAKWLGWLDEPMRMRSRLGDLERFVEELAAPGLIDTFVLLGMGGSSLAPEVIRRSFGAESFHVLDTTHPAASGAGGVARLRRDALHRRLQVGHDAGDALASRLLLGAGRQARRVLRGDHRPGLGARAAGQGARLPRHLRRRADDRRALLGALGLRPRPGGADGRRPRAPPGARRGDGRGLPRRGGQPGPRARARARQRLAATGATR